MKEETSTSKTLEQDELDEEEEEEDFEDKISWINECLYISFRQIDRINTEMKQKEETQLKYNSKLSF